MTDRHNLREKIARALFDYTVKAYQVPESDMLHPVDFRNEADAVLAVIDVDAVRAEAQVEVLRDTSATLAGAEPQHLGDATEGLEFFDYGTGAEYGIDVAAAYLWNVANETARAAGIETEEKN